MVRLRFFILCIPFILSGSLNEAVATYVPCTHKNNLRLRLQAPLVTHNNYYASYLFHNII